jgi:hypothetical protein
MRLSLSRNVLHQRIYPKDWLPVYDTSSIKEHRENRPVPGDNVVHCDNI